MAIVFSVLSALLYGTADFSGGYASRRNPIVGVLIWSQLAGLVMVVLFALWDGRAAGEVFTGGSFLPAGVTVADLAWGALAGLGGMGGLAFLYRGLSRGYVSIVSPLAAVAGAAVPVLFGVLSGEVVRPLAAAGIAISLPAIVLMSWNRTGAVTHRDAARLRASWLDGGISGAMFGLFFIAISMPGSSAGMWPLAAARITSITVMWVGASLLGRSSRIEASHVLVLAAGILDMGANIAFVLALRWGLLAVVTVVVSAYPAQTVLLSRIVLGERIGVIRTTGIALALVGIALMSVG
jgi:drug/metabolite transporter (DMT)-like permease